MLVAYIVTVTGGVIANSVGLYATSEADELITATEFPDKLIASLSEKLVDKNLGYAAPFNISGTLQLSITAEGLDVFTYLSALEDEYAALLANFTITVML